MKKVLLPVDGSDCALRAVALVIAKRAHYRDPNDLDIHLINVQAPFSSEISRFASDERIATFHRQESAKAMRVACELLDVAGAQYSCHQQVGDIAETITALAHALHCDQIAMGAQGHGTVKEFFVGSTAQKTAHLSGIPVLLVK